MKINNYATKSAKLGKTDQLPSSGYVETNLGHSKQVLGP